MKNRFKAISIFLSLTLLINLFINTYDVKASTPLLGGPSSIFPWFDWSIEALKEVGLIFDPERVNNIPSVQDLKDAIEENDPEADLPATDQGINDYINNNITTNNTDNSITYNDKSKFVVNYIGDYLKEQNSYKYLYGCSLQASQSYFGSNIIDIAGLLNNNKNGLCLITKLGNNTLNPVAVCDIYQKNYVLYGVITQEFDENWKRISLYKVVNNNRINHVEPFVASSEDEAVIYYALNASSIEKQNYTYPTEQFNGYMCALPQQSCGGSDWGYYPKFFTYGNNGIVCFNSLNGLNTYIENTGIGKYPYYTNNEVYSNWSNSSGDYTVDSNNRNNIDYSQVTNYIDNSYTENGTYPSLPDINNYITIENTPNNDPPPPDNPSGGGGSGGSVTATANNEGINININNNHSLIIGGSTLSGNTVSGNGSGENGSGGIFDFLGQIGHTIGNFVKNIGQVLADIVTGLGEVVSSLLESIPTIFGDFLGALIGWLPAELRALITLSITAMILVGLIKLFRG